MPPAYLKGPDVPPIRYPMRARCTAKVVFESHALAAKVAARRRKEYARVPYHCDICGRWHLGTGTVHPAVGGPRNSLDPVTDLIRTE